MKPADYDLLWTELKTLLFISLSRGRFAVLDVADERISLSNWFFKPSGDSGYATRAHPLNRQRHLRLHAEMIPLPKGKEVDHKNGIGTDNRRCNLREVTRQQNLLNRRGWGASGFKGVYENAGAFNACINVGGKKMHLGRTKDKEEAARLFDLHAVKYYGEFAKLNYPHRRPEYEALLQKQSA